MLTAEDTLLGEGAILLIDKATPPLIQFLRSKYIEDPYCLSGDIDFLFTFEGVTPQKGDEDVLANYERLWKAISGCKEKKPMMFARK